MHGLGLSDSCFRGRFLRLSLASLVFPPLLLLTGKNGTHLQLVCGQPQRIQAWLRGWWRLLQRQQVLVELRLEVRLERLLLRQQVLMELRLELRLELWLELLLELLLLELEM